MAGDEEGNPTPASYASPPRVDNGDNDGDHVNDRTESGISSRTTASSATARRDRVSVGSRMTRTIIVRPREHTIVRCIRIISPTQQTDTLLESLPKHTPQETSLISREDLEATQMEQP